MSKLFEKYAGCSLTHAIRICREEKLDFDEEFMIPFINFNKLGMSGKQLEVKTDSYEDWKQAALTQLQQEIIDTDEPLPGDKALEPILLARYQDYVNECKATRLQEYNCSNQKAFDEQLDREAEEFLKALVKDK